MANRSIDTNFWKDPKVVDNFTPEDKYFMLYLLTNPNNNICGILQASLKTIENDTGYNKDTIKNLINRFKDIHKLIDYNEEEKEIIILNWYKYNWNVSPKLITCLHSAIVKVKTDRFRAYLLAIIEVIEEGTIKKISEISVDYDTLSIRYLYHTNTKSNTNTKTNSLSKEIIDYLNIKTNSNYRYTSESTNQFIKARLDENYTLEDFKYVIDIKSNKWLNDPKMSDFLRPKTLFAKTNFESYLNEKPTKPNKPKAEKVGNYL